MRHVPGNHPSWRGPVSLILFESSQKDTCPGWVMSPAFEFGKYVPAGTGKVPFIASCW